MCILYFAIIYRYNILIITSIDLNIQLKSRPLSFEEVHCVIKLAFYHAQTNKPPHIIIPLTTRSMRQNPIMSLALSFAIASAGIAQNG